VGGRRRDPTGPIDGRRDRPAAESAPGTIRGDFGLDLGQNVIHASDHEDEGANEREIDLFFDEEELVDYGLDTAAWVYEDEQH